MNTRALVYLIVALLWFTAVALLWHAAGCSTATPC